MIPLLVSMFVLGAPVSDAWAQSTPSRDASAAAPLDEPPAGPPLEGVAADRESRRIASGLRCPVCQGLSVADSNADAAVAMKSRIDELVRQGYTEQQIVDYFVDRYGEFVRLDPEAEGLNLLLWLVPAAVLLGGGAWWWTTASGREEETPEAGAPAGTAKEGTDSTGDPLPAGASDDPYIKAILDEVGPPPVGGVA